MGFVPNLLEKIGDSALRIVWSDGHESVYQANALRRQCPCAVCKPYDSLGAPRSVPPPSVEETVCPTSVQPVGRYGLHITWSDGHATGIYAYDYLRQLCACEACQPKQLGEG